MKDLLERKLARAVRAKEQLENEIEKKTRDLYLAKCYSEQIIEGLRNSVVITNGNGEIVQCNSAFYDLFKSDIVEGQKIEDSFFSEELLSLEESELPLKEEVECKFRNSKGQFIDVIVLVNQIEDIKNLPQRIYLIKDTTEINTLMRSFANFTKLNPSPVFRINDCGRILEANERAKNIFKFNDQSSWFELSDELNIDRAADLISHDGSLMELIEYRGRAFYFKYKAVKEDKYINVYGFDITKQKKSEEKVKLLQDELIDQAYNQGVAENSIHVLHNIGNVLTSITGHASLMKERAENNGTSKLYRKVLGKLENMEFEDLTPEVFGNLKKALLSVEAGFEEEFLELYKNNEMTLDECNRIGDIIATQQKYANQKVKIRSVLYIADVVDDIYLMHKYRLDKSGIKFETDIGRDCVVMVEKIGLCQTMTNAIVNAIEAINERKKFDRDYKGESLRVWTKVEGQRVKVFFEDNGVGIKSADLENIFNYGFSTKDRGSGFGLHNCANYMKNNEGSIEILSDGLNQGACTVLDLGLYKEES